MTAFVPTGFLAKHLPGEDEIDDADLYGRFTISPEAKARADAEWEASDWRGRLPEGWTYKGEAE